MRWLVRGRSRCRESSWASNFELASLLHLFLESQSSPLGLCPLSPPPCAPLYPSINLSSGECFKWPASALWDQHLDSTPRPPLSYFKSCCLCCFLAVRVRSEFSVVSNRGCSSACVPPFQDDVMVNLLISFLFSSLPRCMPLYKCTVSLHVWNCTVSACDVTRVLVMTGTSVSVEKKKGLCSVYLLSANNMWPRSSSLAGLSIHSASPSLFLCVLCSSPISPSHPIYLPAVTLPFLMPRRLVSYFPSCPIFHGVIHSVGSRRQPKFLFPLWTFLLDLPSVGIWHANLTSFSRGRVSPVLDTCWRIQSHQRTVI